MLLWLRNNVIKVFSMVVYISNLQRQNIYFFSFLLIGDQM